MNLRFLLPFSAAVLVFPLHAQEEADLPSGRNFIELRENERNPFGAQVTIESGQAIESVESEEARLRRIIGALRVSGVTQGPSGYTAMIGPMRLVDGDSFPPLLRNQVEELKVESVSREQIRLVFVERDPGVEPRQIVLQISTRPTVRQFLFGEAFENLAQIGADGRPNLDRLESRGVENVLKGFTESDLQSLTDRSFNLLGAKRDESPEEKTE